MSRGPPRRIVSDLRAGRPRAIAGTATAALRRRGYPSIASSDPIGVNRRPASVGTCDFRPLDTHHLRPLASVSDIGSFHVPPRRSSSANSSEGYYTATGSSSNSLSRVDIVIGSGNTSKSIALMFGRCRKPIEGQEVLTSDKIGVRVTLIAQYKIADPVLARHTVGDAATQLYQDLQLTLRESITGKTLEEVLRDREIISTQLIEAVAERARSYGIELARAGVKDIILPGQVRAVFLQEVEADLKGRASLVAARHEVAAARARANTAKLLQENPNILRLQELETLAALASKAGNVLIIPGLHALLTRESTGDPRPAS